MRRTATVLLIVLTGMVASSSPVLAAPSGPGPAGRPWPHRLTGTFASTSTWSWGSSPCPTITQDFSGTFDPDRPGVGGGTYTMATCVDLPTEGSAFPMTGTFEVATDDGIVLRGTMTGTTLLTGSLALPVEFTLTVTESSGARRPIRGTISAVGTSVQTPDPANPARGTSIDSGTFTADLRPGRR
jgi:hypothetical protein